MLRDLVSIRVCLGVRRSLLTFSELSVHLPSEDMEEIGRSGHVSDLHVAILMLAVEFLWCREYSGIFIAKLEISLHSPR